MSKMQGTDMLAYVWEREDNGSLVHRKNTEHESYCCLLFLSFPSSKEPQNSGRKFTFKNILGILGSIRIVFDSSLKTNKAMHWVKQHSWASLPRTLGLGHIFGLFPHNF